MEDGLILKYTNYDYITFHSVLIFIVMEDGLVQTKQKVFISRLKCLNPYCNGRRSRTSLQIHT